jgi:broad specificity phosphatase PhoE
MSKVLPIVYLARHGKTAWTISGQHTGLTDLPLTERGERNARQLGERLRGVSFARVFTSPLQHAARTTLIVFSSFSFVFMSMKPLVVVHFYLINPLYDIPKQLRSIVAHLMIFSKP